MNLQITYQDLYALKEEYKYHKIIYLLFEGKEFIFRSLGRQEYNEIISIIKDEKDLEDVICQTALLFPQDYDMSMCTFAGLPPYASKLIVQESKFTDLDELLGMLDQASKITERFDYKCMTVIKAAMPEYTIEEMQGWTWEQLMFYTSLGQKILNLTLDEESKIVLTDNRGEVQEHQEKQVALIDNKEFIKTLRQNGIDPMIYFDLPVHEKKSLLEDPFLGGRHWQNEGVMNAIRQSVLQRRHRRNTERR